MLHQQKNLTREFEALNRKIPDTCTAISGMAACLPQISDKMQEHGDRIDQLEKQIIKSSRMQYKNSQEIAETMNQLDERTTGWSEILESVRQNSFINKQLQQRLDSMTETMIGLLDDVDILLQGENREQDSSWRTILENWAGQILRVLGEAGITETKLTGCSFDPQWAEAIGSIPRTVQGQPGSTEATRSVPYEIAEVVRRCFVRNDGSIFRKGQVISYRDDCQECE
jgi:molecular chaperone GrpE (heat shock protein)